VADPFPAPVIASEAKQSRGVIGVLDCFVATLSATPAGAHRKGRHRSVLRRHASRDAGAGAGSLQDVPKSQGRLYQGGAAAVKHLQVFRRKIGRFPSPACGRRWPREAGSDEGGPSVREKGAARSCKWLGIAGSRPSSDPRLREGQLLPPCGRRGRAGPFQNAGKCIHVQLTRKSCARSTRSEARSTSSTAPCRPRPKGR